MNFYRLARLLILPARNSPDTLPASDVMLCGAIGAGARMRKGATYPRYENRPTRFRAGRNSITVARIARYRLSVKSRDAASLHLPIANFSEPVSVHLRELPGRVRP